MSALHSPTHHAFGLSFIVTQTRKALEGWGTQPAPGAHARNKISLGRKLLNPALFKAQARSTSWGTAERLYFKLQTCLQLDNTFNFILSPGLCVAQTKPLKESAICFFLSLFISRKCDTLYLLNRDRDTMPGEMNVAFYSVLQRVCGLCGVYK